MGCGISNLIIIYLDRINSFYLSGECVSGTVQLNIIDRKLEADQIHITLIGEIGYRTGGGLIITQPQPHHVPFLSKKVILSKPRPGQNQLVYNQEEYLWPFQIRLPEYLPPTLNHPQEYPHVRYYLQVVIDKPWYKPNSREKRFIRIFPCVNLLENCERLRSTIFGNEIIEDITLKGTLNKFGYVPGETIIANLEIYNPRSVFIQQIDVSMLQSCRIERNSDEFTLVRRKLPRIINSEDQRIKQTFSIVIPDILLPPSYQFKGGTRLVENVHLHYFLQFTIGVEGIFNDFGIDVPFILGTTPSPDVNQQETYNPLLVTYSWNPEQSMLTDDDPLPSYDSFIKNMN
jgi:hypothetical protein